jgi:LPS sulfotransferase NodH
MTDAPVFVVGVARSGTTLLSAMLSAHSRLDCGPESRFFARYRHLSAAQRRHTLDPATWPAGAVDYIDSLCNQGHPIVELFGLSLEDVRTFLERREPSLAAMLESLTVQHAERAGKARWIEKTPRHLRMLDTLRELWPAACVVRIVRDPRDVAISLAGMPFATDSVVANLVRVDDDDRASRDLIDADPGAMTLRYEDLIADPEAELRRICDFIGEDYEPAMLDSRGSAAEVAAEHEWWKGSVSGPLTSARVGRWKTEMEPEAQHFAALHLAGYLREHGYEGAADAAGEVAVVPVGPAVGPKNEAILTALAAADEVVVRPAPRSPARLRAQDQVVFVGVRGQLDPCRNRPARERLLSVAGMIALLLGRWLRRDPVGWVRSATLRGRRPNDPGELVLAGLLRLFARAVAPAEVAD